MPSNYMNQNAQIHGTLIQMNFGCLISTSFLQICGNDFTPETGSFQDLGLGMFGVCNMQFPSFCQ